MKRKSNDTSRRKRRRANFSELVELEISNGDLQDPNVNNESLINCGQKKDATYLSHASSPAETEYKSDEELFDCTYFPVDVHFPESECRMPSPILYSPVSKSSRKLKPASKCSQDWDGDDSLLLKCSEDLFSSRSQSAKKSRTSFANVSSPGNVSSNSSLHKGDSVFGNMDLTMLEKQMNGNETKIKDLNVKSSVKNSEPKTRSPASSITINSTVNSVAFNELPQKSNMTTIENKRKALVPFASTPNKPISTGGSLTKKIRERLKANARQQTTSIHLRNVNVSNQNNNEANEEQETSIIDGLQEYDIGPFYGLPKKVRELMASLRGIKTFYKWQHKCLMLKSVQKGNNLIYSLPTSGGKTLVAEILIMKELLCKKRNAILVLPFVAIVQEKVRNIVQFADELDFLVEEYAGGKGKIPPTKRRKRNSLYICTIEKANSLVNSLIEASYLDSIGLVVVDELHMLGEGGRRGATIEMMLAKIMHVSASTQIIGMSATLSNIGDLAKFLNSEVYTNDFRPVCLEEHVKQGNSLYRVDSTKLNPDERLSFDRIIQFPNKEMSFRDTDHLATLVLEVIPEHSCLVFCATKKNCENVATMICKLLPTSLTERKAKEKRAILETLYQDSGKVGICPTLQKTVKFGVAYHHSGLTSDERKLIEEAYTDGVLCVLACTSTLAAGVNLPARRVIIRSPYVGRNFLSRSQYKQMVGRAGRAGIDTKGESYLIITNQKDKQKVMELVTGPVETCFSSLMYDSGKGFKTLLLNLIGLKIMKRMSDVSNFFTHTLFAVQLKTMPERFPSLSTSTESHGNGISSVENVTKHALQELLDLKLIKLEKLADDQSMHESLDITDYNLSLTRLGLATLRGSIDLSQSNAVYIDLKQGLQSLVLAGYLHLLYLVTPHDVSINIKPNWMMFFDEYGKLSSDEQKAATVIGVPENYVAMRAAGHNMRKSKVKEEVCSRFYITLMLYLLFRGRTVWDIAARFDQPRGFLQSLISSAVAFASCILHFTKELEEFWPYHALLAKLIQALQYCTTAELIPLVEIPGVKLARAKQLFNAGFKTLAQIAKANPSDLMKNVDHLPRKQALQIIASAKVLLKEKIEDLQAAAEELQAVPNIL